MITLRVLKRGMYPTELKCIPPCYSLGFKKSVACKLYLIFLFLMIFITCMLPIRHNIIFLLSH